MIEERMALAELLRKSGDSDFLRAVAEAVLQTLMEAEVEGLIGAILLKQNDEKVNDRLGREAVVTLARDGAGGRLMTLGCDGRPIERTDQQFVTAADLATFSASGAAAEIMGWSRPPVPSAYLSTPAVTWERRFR